MENLWDVGINVIGFLQNLGGWLLAPMKFLTFVGTEEFYLLLMPALYWCWEGTLGLRLGLMLLLSAGLNDALKLAFHQARPYWVVEAGQETSALSNNPRGVELPES